MIQSPFLTALFHPVNMMMFALAVVAGLVSAWWLTPLGIVLWIVMVILVARDPGLRMTFSRVNRQPLAQRFQYRFDKLDRARFTIFNAMGESRSPALEKVVEPLQTTLDELVEHAYQLSAQLSALDNNFAIQKMTGNFESEISNLQENLRTAKEETGRKEYMDTLQSLQTRQEQLNKVDGLLSRFELQLTGTSSAIDGVVMSVASFKGRDPKLAAEKIPAMVKVIQEEQQKLSSFDKEVEKLSLM
jgi:uncharacterized protein (DUF3084 family)